MKERVFVDNKEKKRYELHVDGHVAEAEYIINKHNVVYMTHTSVPVALEGRGVGSELIARSLAYIKDQGMTVFPICPFVISYLRKHPEWDYLVHKDK